MDKRETKAPHSWNSYENLKCLMLLLAHKPSLILDNVIILLQLIVVVLKKIMQDSKISRKLIGTLKHEIKRKSLILYHHGTLNFEAGFI